MESETARLAAKQSINIKIDSSLPLKVKAPEARAVVESVFPSRLDYDQAFSPESVTRITSNIFDQTLRVQKAASVVESLVMASVATGAHVQLIPEMSFCPILMGDDKSPVYLYEFVEALEDVVDYDDIKKELPSLSVHQISGAIAFLRKISQFNAKGIDIDELEDEELVNDEAFLSELRKAFADQEVARVLNDDKSDR